MSDFWARRKAAVAAETQAEAEALRAEERAEFERAQAEKSDAEVLEELGLPDPDDLAAGDDIKDFLADAVPQRLKTRALRRFWRLNPVLANLDGLLEYGEDYTDAATVVENLQTAYQVGKGMTAHVEALAKAAEADEVDAEGAPEHDAQDEADIVAEAAQADDVALADNADPELPDVDSVAPSPAIAVMEDGNQSQPNPPPRQRMRFVFEDMQEDVA